MSEKSDKGEGDSSYTELVENVLSELELFLSGQVNELFDKTDEFLFNAADNASSIDEQNRLFEFMNSLRVEKVNIEKVFVKEFNCYLKPLAEDGGKVTKKHRDSDNTLGLIEQDEMDEMVAITTISGKAKMDFQEAISHLEARLEHLGLLTQHIFLPRALEPVNFCHAFQESLNTTEFSIRNKLILYKIFGQQVTGQLYKLYDSLNKLMIDAGILPQIELSNEIKKSAERDVAVYGGDESPEITDDMATNGNPGNQAQTGHGGYGGGASSATGMAGGTAGATSRMSAGAPGTSGPGMAGAGGGHAQGQTTGGAGGAVPGPLAAYPPGDVRQTIESFVGGAPSEAGAAGGPGVEGGSSAAGGYYSHTDMVSALSTMQSNAYIDPSARLEFNASAIKQSMLATIGERDGGVVNKRVNQVSEKTIDFIKLIFDAIIEDKSITDTIKTLLLSLQIPVIKAAMIDPDFFVDDQHPARLLLDKLAEAGVGISDHHDEIFKSLEKIVTSLLNDYDEDVIAFEQAYDELSALTEEIYRSAREREEESQKQVKYAHARNIVLQEIRKITLGKELPANIRGFVLKVWPSLMFNHYLKHGKANDEWVEMMMILAKVIESVQPLSTREEQEELGLSHEDIVNAVEEKLKKSRKSQQLIDDVIAGLASTYTELMQVENLPEQEELATEEASDLAAEANEADEAVSDERLPDDESIATEADTATEKEAEPEGIHSALQSLPEDVQPGTWFIVYNGEDKPVRRLKLAVILTQDATLVFVDHLGNVVIEKTAKVFAEELSRGLSGVIMQHSVFDYALKSALDSINH